jgi:tetratricopeptide (TPR) repeat protein
MLCGQLPFEGDSTMVVLYRIRTDDRVELADRKPGLPAAIYDLVTKATAHKASERYQSADEFAQAARNALADIDEAHGPTVLKVEEPYGSSTVKKSVPGKDRRRRAFRVSLAALVAVAIVLVAYIVAMVVSPPTYDTGIVLARANDLMNTGDDAGVVSYCQEVLTNDPDNVDARYALGYAYLRQHDPAKAEEEFGTVSEASKRTEGQAAAAYARDGLKARPSIVEAHDAASTAYLATLLCLLDLAEGKPDEAVNRGEGLPRDGFSFDWQYYRLLSALGQAYEQLQQFDKAEEKFRQLQANAPGQFAAIASSYLRLLEQRRDQETRAEAVQMAERIRDERAKAVEPSEPVDAWSSRELTFAVLPPQAGTSLLAIEGGFTTLLPMELGETLRQATPMNPVEREDLLVILGEQELAAYLNPTYANESLGKFLGARVMVRCEFHPAGRGESIYLRITDVETLESIGVPKITVGRDFDPMDDAERTEFLQNVASAVWDVVATRYPLQGVVANADDGPRINLGEEVGLRPGMRFKIAAKADPSFVIPDRSVVVTEAIGNGTARVDLEGFGPDEKLPETGLYVFTEEPPVFEGDSGGMT